MNSDTSPENKPLGALALAALGIVYGDIGTSPLYTIKEVFANPHHPVPITPENVLGILSLIVWSLIVVVTIKYVLFIMRADNKGEGGLMALMALALRPLAEGSREQKTVLTLGIFGTALFYGDGVITPAISVLSAVEGLEIATPALKPYVVPVTLVVLIALFSFQRHGTAGIGALFGPVMVLWFFTLAALGIANIADHSDVLLAINPQFAEAFIAANPTLGFFAMGAVFLAVTGTEALYADMGHFGRRPVQLAWLVLVLPALILNYFGQGALLLANPTAIENPFYRLVPEWGLYPLVGLATLATVIASQAVISGAFSMTRQAIQLGYLPRMEVQHTSEHEIGQIYLPAVNWLLLAAVIGLVLGFKSSTNLAAAYGIAVSGMMIITTLIAYIVVRRLWGWSLAASGALTAALLAVDVAFLAANAIKIEDGGWFPLVFGMAVFTAMTTWRLGRGLVSERVRSDALPLEPFVADMAANRVPRVPGTAVFMTQDMTNVPFALLHSLKHYKVLHERVVFVTVAILDIPHVPDSDRVVTETLPDEFYRIRVYYGYMDAPNLPTALARCAESGLELDMMDTTFFLGRETLITSFDSEMPYWRELLFVALFRNAGSATAFFQIPSNRVVELGSQVVL
ncbi:MAG: potassium transporter Kup [Rhodocyclales bacterium]|nr:potassium transporter Kup [Rhodocyclales bacterium]